jgi:hypothetical protein
MYCYNNMSCLEDMYKVFTLKKGESNSVKEDQKAYKK